MSTISWDQSVSCSWSTTYSIHFAKNLILMRRHKANNLSMQLWRQMDVHISCMQRRFSLRSSILTIYSSLFTSCHSSSRFCFQMWTSFVCRHAASQIPRGCQLRPSTSASCWSLATSSSCSVVLAPLVSKYFQSRKIWQISKSCTSISELATVFAHPTSTEGGGVSAISANDLECLRAHDC